MRRWKVILIAKVVLGFATVGTALGQCYGPAEDCRPCPQEGCDVPVALPNGATIEQDHQGRIWLNIPHKKLTVQVGREGKLNAKPTENFVEAFSINNPDPNVVNGPSSESFQIEGNCQTRFFHFLSTGDLDFGDLSYLGESVLFGKVVPGSPIDTVFRLVCQD